MNLLAEAREYNSSLEHSYLALAVVLHEIHQNETYKEEGFEDFPAFYKSLGREKSTISRLLGVGKWLKETGIGLPVANVSYRRLNAAIKQYPDKDPQYVLSVAQTWNEDDFKTESKEQCKRHEYEEFCKHCWKKK